MLDRIRGFSSYIGLAGAAAFMVGVLFLLLGEGALTLKNEIPLALGVILLAIYVLLNPAQVRQALTGRTARYGGNALLMSVAFLGILGMLNFLAARHHKRFDLTENKRYTLSNQTIQVLKGLKEPVKITAFMRGGTTYEQEVADLLKEYSYYTDKLTYEIVDPDLKPSLARQYQIASYNTIVYECGDRRQESFGTQERDVTAAILKVSDTTQRTVYFLTGHGERSIDDYTDGGFSQFKLALERDNYVVKSLNLLITDTIPADCVAIVIARPTQDILEQERNVLFRYLLGAGKALIMQDPGYDGKLNDLLAGYLVKFRDDVVVDPSSSLFGDVGVPVVQRYPYHVITQKLPMTLFPLARSVVKLEGASEAPGVTITSLVETTDKGWGETRVQEQRVRFDEGEDHKGPVSIAMVVDLAAGISPEKLEAKTSHRTRLAVFGDSDFASNAAITSVGNLDLALNTINWLTEQEELVSIRPKEEDYRQLVLNAGQARLIRYSSMIFLPLIVLAIGAGIWWNRR